MPDVTLFKPFIIITKEKMVTFFLANSNVNDRVKAKEAEIDLTFFRVQSTGNEEVPVSKGK